MLAQSVHRSGRITENDCCLPLPANQLTLQTVSLCQRGKQTHQSSATCTNLCTDGLLMCCSYLLWFLLWQPFMLLLAERNVSSRSSLIKSSAAIVTLDIIYNTLHTPYSTENSIIITKLTLSSPVVSNGYTSKCSGPYLSNPPFLMF